MDVKFIICFILLSLCCVQFHGQKTYNYSSEICCNGVVNPQVNTGTACCGDATYQAYTYGEDIYSNSQSLETCCSGKAYNTKTQMCCNGQMQPIVGQPEDNICCGDKIYPNPESNLLCCDGQALPTIGKFYLNQCCGNKNYNIADPRGICCNNVLHDVPYSFIQCCGSVTYDKTKQSCCNETILNEPFIDCFDYACAGRNLLQNEICCKGAIFNLSREGLYYRSGISCCGSTIVRNPSKEICCLEKGVVVAGNSSYQGCCGTTAYNYATHLCCDSTLYPTSGNQQLLCCGSEFYDYSKQICCIDVVISVADATQMSCCLPDSTYYL